MQQSSYRIRTSGLFNVTPRHVENCSHNRERARWFVHSWLSGDNQGQKMRPYVCHSWRCPHCQEQEAKILYARAKEAFSSSSERVSFFVLTVPQKKTDTADIIREKYRKLSEQTRKLFKRLGREMFRTGLQDSESFGNRWFAVVESHASGQPHLNVMVQSESLARLIDREEKTVEESKNHRLKTNGNSGEGNYNLLHGVIAKHAKEVGFGRVSGNVQGSFENALAYCLKTAKEMNKLLQLPLMMASKMRRHRAGKGFLPKSLRQVAKEIHDEMGKRGGCLTRNEKPFTVESPQEKVFSKKLNMARNFLESVPYLFTGKGRVEAEKGAREEVAIFEEKVNRTRTAIRYATATCDDKLRVNEVLYSPLAIQLEEIKQKKRKEKKDANIQQNNNSRLCG